MPRSTIYSAVALCCLCGIAAADNPEAPKNKSSINAEPTANTSLLVQAAQLAVEGESRKSPMLLLSAAELLLDLTPSQRTPEAIAVSMDGDNQRQPSTLPPLTVDGLIQRAVEISAKDPELAKAVETVALKLQSGDRGIVARQGKDLPRKKIKDVTFCVLNVKKEYRRLEPGQSYTANNVIYEASKPAIALVVGDGDGDLDLWVYDDNSDNLIGRDTDSKSVCLVQWTPRYEGPFRIIVKNVGKQWEQFYVLANW